ncbi:hypothetical protein GH741_18240 [Aquibacillus halophilus]|uniref:Uncharacterized protein n=2 Tax=Aquibacillus halophilus TaxID=930132 RepID=A0A6A8DLF3_9BACI|nr:hypothetical protein [Aquibacillus halophilus]MRH44589.1 hypothetical protein [Aquibacillus halophilus]
MLHIKRITTFGLLLGFIVFMSSFFASGISSDYLLSIGLGILVASMMTFGCSLCLNLMQDITESPNNYSQLKQTTHEFKTQ